MVECCKDENQSSISFIHSFKKKNVTADFMSARRMRQETSRLAERNDTSQILNVFFPHIRVAREAFHTERKPAVTNSAAASALNLSV